MVPKMAQKMAQNMANPAIDPNLPVTLERDCEAHLIPMGTPLLLPAGSVVFITQALGGSFTVNVSGNLARINGADADALGMAVPEEARVAAPAQGQSPPGSPAGSPLGNREGKREAGAEVGGAVDESLIWEQLRTCYDPEIPINIVDLGLIYECRVSPMKEGGNQVHIVMTLTAPGCGMGEFLAADVRSRVAQVPNVSQVDVELTFDPPWDRDRMSEAARLETGFL